jgi:hypothetical protein
MSGNTMVTLNYRNRGGGCLARRVELLEALKIDARIADHHRLDAVRAHL